MSDQRSILEEPPVRLHRLHDGRPILEPIEHHSWESRVVLNAAAALIDDRAQLLRLARRWDLSDSHCRRVQESGGVVALLYRAQGEIDEKLGVAPSSLGLAVFTPGFEIIHRFAEPVLRPERAYDRFGVEDPRATMIGEECHLYYTGFAPAGDNAGHRIQVCLATTTDFLDWRLFGPDSGDINSVDNKNAALVPNTVGNKWLLIHRPMQGEGAMSIHLADSDSPKGPWSSRGVLMTSFDYSEFDRSWIGVGGPPVPLGEERFLMIYHLGHMTSDGSREYDLGAALLDFSRRHPVVARIEPVMRPETPMEKTGDRTVGVDNVVFTCANYVLGDDLVIPYAGADSRILVASVPLAELVNALEQRTSAE